MNDVASTAAIAITRELRAVNTALLLARLAGNAKEIERLKALYAALLKQAQGG
jgi:hypothetical protein